MGPLKLPAPRPLPGRLADTMPTEREDGAGPLAEEMVNQAPPSDVVAEAVQSSVPAPAFLIGTDCAAGLAPPGTWKKLTPLGVSSKEVAFAGLTVNETGITIDGLPAPALTMISAVYTPAGSVMSGLTVTISVWGALMPQQP